METEDKTKTEQNVHVTNMFILNKANNFELFYYEIRESQKTVRRHAATDYLLFLTSVSKLTKQW